MAKDFNELVKDNEFMGKVAKVTTANELIDLAKEQGYEITEEEAQGFIDDMNTDEELSEDDAKEVAGGAKKGTKWHICSNCGSAYLTKASFNLHLLFNGKKLGCKSSHYFTEYR